MYDVKIPVFKIFYPSLPQMVQSGMVCMWAVRLGLFLFWRVMKAGEDSRFRRVKNNPSLFFIYWTIQGSSVRG